MNETGETKAAEITEAAEASKGKQTGQRIAKVLVFLGIFCVMLYFLCDIFEYPNNYISYRYTLYKDFEPDTVDAVMIGTSGFDRSWIAAKGFEKFGITVYPLAVDAMPCYLAIDMIKEAYRFQNPKLVILDMRMFSLFELEDNIELGKVRARRVIDILDYFSPNRFDAIKRTLNAIHEADPKESKFNISFLLSFIQFHSKWNEEDFKLLDEIGSKNSPYLGFYLTKNSAMVKTLKETKWSDERMDLTKNARESLDEILDYCEQHDIELLFLDTPHYLSDVQVKRTNALCDILDSKGIKWVSFAGDEWTTEESNFDSLVRIDGNGRYAMHFNGLDLAFDTRDRAWDYFIKHTFDSNIHFYDNSHLNFDGAVILTRLLGDYLVNNYDLAKHTDDPKCADWIDVYPKIKKKVKKYKNSIEKAEVGELTDYEREQMEREDRNTKNNEE